MTGRFNMCGSSMTMLGAARMIPPDINLQTPNSPEKGETSFDSDNCNFDSEDMLEEALIIPKNAATSSQSLEKKNRKKSKSKKKKGLSNGKKSNTVIGLYYNVNSHATKLQQNGKDSKKDEVITSKVFCKKNSKTRSNNTDSVFKRQQSDAMNKATKGRKMKGLVKNVSPKPKPSQKKAKRCLNRLLKDAERRASSAKSRSQSTKRNSNGTECQSTRRSQCLQDISPNISQISARRMSIKRSDKKY